MALYQACFILNHEPKSSLRILTLLNNLAYTLVRKRDHERATMMLEESLARLREQGDKQGIAMSLHNVSSVVLEQGSYTRTSLLLGESPALCQKLGGSSRSAEWMAGLAAVAGVHPQTKHTAWRE